MKRLATILLLVIAAALPAGAQDRVWLQIEAHPTLREAEERARTYAGTLPNVGAFRIASGWYSIALGPYAEPEANAALRTMRAQGAIPRDSFISDGADFRQQVWPVGAELRTPVPTATPAPETRAAAPLQPLPDETPAEARQSERALDRDGRALIQTALQWEGFYAQAIDAAFGPGTRRAMADWQAALGYEPTGVLTTRQREELVGAYRAEIARLGMQPIDEREAGIRIEMPLGLVEFDRYEPPFVHYRARGDSGVRALLISQRGDQATLYGLYDIMQTLEIVPLGGTRERNTTSFTLAGQNARLQSYTYARLIGGAVKGFTLVWPPTEDEKLMMRAAMTMRETLDSVPNVALDETLGEASADQRADMLSGLEIRQPDATHSGFFIDGAGTVLTTTTGLTACNRITIGHDVDVTLTASDPALGLAVLKPSVALAPIEYASFQARVPRLRSDVAVAGFSYGEVLDLPVLTYGTLADLTGLDGQDAVARLEIEALPGDTGGPVLDAAGAVLGVLLAPGEGARQLPQNVRYAADVAAIGAFLSANGVEMRTAEAEGALPPAALTRRAADMTVPVSCWN
ncbi:serine protease [Rhodovulum marinum]|uniref:Putative peptidoglycan binding protein n=1 Tax=Rhodovulum marinum TaxID=320662 RepID=A0A4V2SRJ6_9RHOB|nr:serine protease [Rhodovulum marinum]TCP43216.1 putative peptidoglycan binding protein [Rhodovulum marinum]